MLLQIFKFCLVACIWAVSGSSYAQPALTLSENVVSPGTKITLKFVASKDLPGSAWIGLIPSHVPHGSAFQNEQYHLSRQYLNQRLEGELVFISPWQAGSYDLRMNTSDDNGHEIASVSFIVEGSIDSQMMTPTLSLDKDSYAAGEDIVVKFTAPKIYALDAWIGIIPSSVAHGKESRNDQYDLSYQYINGRTEGTLTFEAPKKGQYDIRMHDTDKNGLEVSSVSFKVL